MILSVFVKKKLAGKKLHPKHPLVQSICGIVLRPGRHFENFILARALKYLPTPGLDDGNLCRYILPPCLKEADTERHSYTNTNTKQYE